jgi:hypothetical protein
MPLGLIPALGLTRIAIGIGLMANPKGIGKALGIDDAAMQQAAWLARFTGGREIAIGLGTLLAWRRSEPLAGWIAAQAISDATDTVAFAVVATQGRVSPARGWGMAVFAASGAISEATTAIRLSRQSRPAVSQLG